MLVVYAVAAALLAVVPCSDRRSAILDSLSRGLVRITECRL